MNDTVPLVSVIMPAYNSERFIEDAVCSVIAQTYTNWELLVIDDGSVDSTCAIAERLAAEDERIQLIRNEINMGVARTRNRGFDLCHGDYVALLDSDDVWHPQKLERQLSRMRKENADVSFCSYAIINEEGIPVKGDYVVPESISLDRLLRENVIGCSTVMLSSCVAKKYKFDAEYYHEDYLMWLRLLADGYVAIGCKDVLAQWRLLKNSRSYNKKRSAANRWKIYREYMNFPLLKSLWLFGNYVILSLRKYLKVNARVGCES